jgi:acyl-CoA synthetase (NDP forming)
LPQPLAQALRNDAPEDSLRVLPVARDVIDEMLNSLRISPVLRGLRGNAGIDFDAVAETALAVAAAVLENDAIAEIEINPLFAYTDRAVAADARAYARPQESPPS